MSDFQFSLVDPRKLDLVKDAVTPGLLYLKATNRCVTFTPEQVYDLIVRGRAELYAAYLDGEYGGFVILAETVEPFTLERQILIWCFYTQRKFPRERELVTLCVEAIDEIARKRGIETVRMRSSRPGWERQGPRRGFEKFDTCWVRKVR